MDRMKRFARKTVSYVVAMTMVFSMMQMSVFAQGETVSSEPTTTAVSDQNSVTAETENNNANTNQTNEESPPASNEATESTKVEEKTDANKSSGEDPSAAQKAAEEKAKAEKEAAEKAEAEKKAAQEKAAAEKKAAEEKAKAEKEAAEKAEAEKKAAENAMPAQTFTGSTSQLKVTASVDANVFPNGTEMKVTPVSSTVAKNIAKKTVKDDKVITDAIGADISFFKDGKELQPADANAVHVSMTLNKSLDGQNFKVVHQKDSGTIEKMNASVNDHKATFNAKSFSIYVIAGENDPVISTYKFYDGDTIISEYTQKIKAGDTLKKPKSPEKEGYKFLGWATTKDAAKPNFDAFKEYSEAEIDGKEHNIYAVFEEVHYVFFMDSAAEGARVFTTKEGKEGDKVSTTDIKLDLASDQSVTGWYSDQALTQKVEDTITLGTSDIRLYPKIESGHYITFKTGKNGSYIEPKFYAAKENVTEKSLPTPTRKGYTFKYWSTTEDGSKYATGNALSEDITLYAVWEANDTNYSVVFWQQSIDDKVGYSDAQKTYKVESSVSRTAKTGQSVSVTNADKNKGYTGFTFKKADSSKTVTADGKTTLNVYYDRRTVTFTFYFPDWSNEYVYRGKTYTGLYGQKFNDWPSYVTNSWSGEKVKALWNDGSTNITFLDAFIPPNLTNFNTEFNFTNSGKATINYYRESLNGSYGNPISVGASGNTYFHITDKFNGFKAYAYSYSNTHPAQSNLPASPDASGEYAKVFFQNELHIYFKRNSYNLQFYNYDHEYKTESVKYEASLSQYAKYTPTRPSSLDEGYKFRGWYKDEACTTPFNFDSTMPAHGIKLYAKWAADPVDVKVHLSLKNDETTTIEDLDYASTISLSDLPKVVDAEGKTLVEGDNGHTVTVPENYHWIGWATKSNESYTLYNFNNELHGDLELYPYYINTSKFVVNYSAGTGSGTVTDDKKYAENAYADVKSGSTLDATSGSKFLNWQLYKFVDGELKATDEYYYPGDKIKITGNIQLVAHYIPLPTKVNLLYYANNSSSSDAVYASNEDLENNAQLIIADGSNVAKPQVGNGVKAIFDHWNTKADDGGTTYKPGIKVGIDEKDLPNKLYAQWRYEVTITGQSKSVTYTGEKQSVTGIVNDTFTIEGKTVTIDDVTAKAEGTDVGEYATTFIFGDSYNDQVKEINGFKVKVITNPGTLTITPNETNIKITLKDASKVYDGKALTSKDIDVTGLPEGFKVNVETSGSQLDAGESKNTITSYTITKGDQNVTKSFKNIEVSKDAKLTVTKRPVTLKSKTASKEFDGTPLTRPDVTITPDDGFVEGEVESVEATGSITEAGTTTNTIQINGVAGKYKEDNYKITKDEGTLTITKIAQKVTFTAASDHKEYDGTALSNEAVTMSGLPAGYNFTASAVGSVTHVNEGKVKNVVNKDSVHIYKEGKDVTNQFADIQYTDGELSITPRKVTLTSASDQKQYDGTPLTNDSVTYDASRILNNDIHDIKATGSQTDVGSSDNTISYKIENNVKDDYEVEEELGQLTVTKNEKKVTIKASDDSKTYDGTPLTSNSFEVFDLNIQIFEVTADSHGSITDAGSTEHTIDNVKISKDGKNVTDWFTNINAESGTLTVQPRPVTITTGSASKEFDGMPLKNKEITVGDMGFVDGEATVRTTGTITEVGSTENTYEIVKGEGYKDGNYAITNNLGTLTIKDNEKTEITITAKSAAKTYDGTPLTAGYEVTGLNSQLFTIEVKTTGSITDVGTTDHVIDSYTIRNNDGNDVTKSFKTIHKVNGTLTINKRQVTLTSKSDSKEFDGTPLTAPDVKVSGDGFVEGEVTDLKATGTITRAGSVANPITYTKTKAFHEDNYVIKEDIGTLTVKKIAKEVTVTSNNASKTYDGTALTNKTYTADSLPNGFTAKVEITGKITNAGSTKNTIKSVVIMKGEDDVTDQFESIVKKEGMLTVEKRQVNLRSASASREYNGLPLTKPKVDITGDGFVKDEVTDVKATGSITQTGKVTNTITYQTHDAFNKDNYTITKQEGTLEITANHTAIQVRAATDEKVYDGTPLTNAKTTIENLPEGFTYKAKVVGSVTHVDEGTVDNKITEIHIYKDDQDVTNQFDAITHMDGTLKITARPLTITSASDEKDYDGIALANNKVTVKGKIFNDEVYDITATGAQIEVGSSANTIVYKMTKHAEKDYAITLEEGLLTVNPHTAVITVTAGSDAKVYDGKALTSDTFTVEGLPDNLRAYVTTDGSATNVGDKGENKVNTVVIMDGMNDVTRYFTNIKTVSGQLTITPRYVTLKSESDHKVYDGKALTRPEVKISGQGFVAGEATAKAVGTIKKIGSVPNTIELATTDAYKEKNYNLTYDLGTLTILANENAVVVNGSSVSKTYDGKALSSDKADVILPEGFENYKAEVKMTGTITNAGKIANKVADVIIRDEDGNDVTDQFKNITKNDGYLEVTPRKVTLTSESVTRAYDGTPLTAKHVTVTGDGFVDGEVSDLKATGSITEVGTTSNAISFQKNDAYKDKNYIITKKPGCLTITTAQVIMHITAASDEKVYDGQSLTNDGYTVAGVLPGMRIEATIKGEITNAGETENKVTAYRIMKGDQDVTDFFNTDDEHMMITDGTLTVKKRPVTLTSATLKKAYDGTALTNGDHHLKVTAGSYVEGESFKAGFTGRQLLAGSSDNTFTLSNHTAKLGNYDVKKEYGQLTVTDDVDDDKVVTKSHDAKEYKLGDTIHFEIKIKNIYDEVKTLKVTELPGVKITSDIPETLSAGEEITLKATYIVTEEEIKSQQFKNKVDVSLGKTYKGTDEVPEPEIDDAKPKLKITKTAEQKEYKLGDTITYKIYAKNTGNLTLTNIVVKDDLTKSSWTIAKLLPGETSQDLIATYKVTESDIKVGKIVNVATVDHIDDPTPDNPDDPAPEVTPGKETVDTEEKNSHITITKKADEKKAYKLGETIHYTIHATNDGNLTLTNIVIRDDLTNQQWTIRSLAPHQTSQDFTATYVVTEKDIKNGHVANVATMKDVDDPTPDDPTDPDPKDEPGKETVDTEDKNPHLTIIKKADDTKKYKLGETVTYTISAINDGNLTLTNIKLEDALTGDTWTIKKLAPQATSDEHVVTYTVTEKDIIAGKIKNIVTMKDVDDPTPEDPNDPDPKDNPGEKTVETEDKHPHLTITKQADTSKQYTLGDTITYTIKAKNDGNLTLTNIILKDDLTGDTFTIDSLKPQEESSNFTVNYKVTQQDVNKGKVTNVATVNKVDDPTPDDPTDPDPEVTPGKEEVDITKTNPSVTVTKKTTSTPKDGKAYQLGETITYEITVKNDGNLPLSAFKLHDDMTNENFDVKVSKPGDTQSFTTSYKVQEADIVKGKVINNATVDTATLEDPTPDNKDDEVKITDGKTEDNTEASHPAVVITKTTTSSPASASGYEEGDTISYLITATNTGNLTLTNVVVEDPLTGGKWTIEKLSPNAQETFVTTYVVKALDVTRGNVVNTATVTSSEDPDPQKDPEVTPGTVTTPTSKTTIIDESGDGTMPTQNTPETPTIATPATEESGSGKQATQNTPDTDTTVEKETVPTYNTDNTTPTVVKTTTYDTGTAPTTTTEAVKTGDETEITMQMMLMSIALITLLGVLIATRKKKENRN